MRGRFLSHRQCGGRVGRALWTLPQHFSSEVPTDFMREALACSANPIYELGLLPIYIALHVWGKRVHSTHLVCYLDNDAARAALCKGYGSTELAQRIVGCAMQLESRFKTKSWYARVPSHSNISDGPSRLDCRRGGAVGVETNRDRLGGHPRESLWSFGCVFKKGRARAHRMIPNCVG